VSRIHCSFLCEGKRLRVKDLGSSNGTYVNGLRITEAVLNAGDTVQIGSVKFVVQIVPEPVARAEPVESSAPATEMPDGEVVFFQADDDIDAEQIIDPGLIEELKDDPEVTTDGAGHAPVPQAENIFAPDRDPTRHPNQFQTIEDSSPKEEQEG